MTRRRRILCDQEVDLPPVGHMPEDVEHVRCSIQIGWAGNIQHHSGPHSAVMHVRMRGSEEDTFEMLMVWPIDGTFLGRRPT